jgi:peptidoglycan/xylan/chitin deacetylase (PgdA/CDA1 family)
MDLARAARTGLNTLDDLFVALGPGTFHADGTLVTVLFHSIHSSRREVGSPLLAPNQDITVDDLRAFLDMMLADGFRPVSPAEIERGIAGGTKGLLITFDDGYFNNTRALDVLAQYQAPALFFISSNHVLQAKGFWWDALARELRGRGAGERLVRREIRRMKLWSHERIEAWLRAQYGPRALVPRSDLDRPFSADELRDFSRNRWVHLGNHTRDHAILPNCRVEEMKQQIEGCQHDLVGITGREPIAIAYPNGGYSRAAVACAQAAGLRVGFTVRPFGNALPLQAGKRAMTLGRHLVWGAEDPRRQCRKLGARFVPSHMIKSLLMSAY